MLTLNVPVAKWQALLDIEDLETYNGPLDTETDSVTRIESEGQDTRYPGVTLELELCSGQTNYWYTVNVWKDGELVGQSEPQDCIDAKPNELVALYDESEIEYAVVDIAK